MPPRPAAVGTPQGMTAARRLPTAKAAPGAGTQLHTPCFLPPHYRIAAGHFKDACGAAAQPGSTRSLTRPAAQPRWQRPRKQDTPKARPPPAWLQSGVLETGREPKENGTNMPLDTARSFRDDLRLCYPPQFLVDEGLPPRVPGIA